MDIKIFIMSHKKFSVPKMTGYFPVQTGSCGKEDLGYLRDDTGINISEKNSSFSELTGLYWIWKNITCEIAGLCHYRRYFMRTDMPENACMLEQMLMPVEEIAYNMQQYDLIVPRSGNIIEENVRQHYEANHNIRDWDACGKIIAKKYPEYYPAFLWNENIRIFSFGNMVIGKKKVLDQYCSWLFDILFELEKCLDVSGRDDYQKRVFGFLAERLFRVWILCQPFKIKEQFMAKIN